MPITLELLENDRVLYYEFTDPWNMRDLGTLYDQARAIRDQHDYIIHAIANLTDAPHLPQNALSIRSYSPDIMHPRAGYVILVGAHALLRKMAELAFRIMHSERFHLAATEEEAWAFIREVIAKESQGADKAV